VEWLKVKWLKVKATEFKPQYHKNKTNKKLSSSVPLKVLSPLLHTA
jgi:hypothetical protein